MFMKNASYQLSLPDVFIKTSGTCMKYDIKPFSFNRISFMFSIIYRKSEMMEHILLVVKSSRILKSIER